MSLTDLKKAVDSRAEQYLPDFVYNEAEKKLHFVTVPLHQILDDPVMTDEVGLRFNTSEHGDLPYLTTDWSRHQILQALGAREKWFNAVSLEEQAAELNKRWHVLDNMMFRTMRGGDEDNLPLRSLRGLVSNVYADIPNTSIAQALLEAMPGDAQVIKVFSGQTDRAFYAYVVLNQPVGISGLELHPGLVIKNSEVGYTSLWVIPFLFFPDTYTVAVLEQKRLLRKVHRGKLNNLAASLEEALQKVAPLWQDIASKIPPLLKKLYATESEALESMDDLIRDCGGSKLFAYRCRQSYQGAGNITHSAYLVFETIVKMAGDMMDKNKAYEHNAIAGAALLKLVL